MASACDHTANARQDKKHVRTLLALLRGLLQLDKRASLKKGHTLTGFDGLNSCATTFDGSTSLCKEENVILAIRESTRGMMQVIYSSQTQSNS